MLTVTRHGWDLVKTEPGNYVLVRQTEAGSDSEVVKTEGESGYHLVKQAGYGCDIIKSEIIYDLVKTGHRLDMT
jgi:hypothetical protein